jgi:hypothetical protein
MGWGIVAGFSSGYGWPRAGSGECGIAGKDTRLATDVGVSRRRTLPWLLLGLAASLMTAGASKAGDLRLRSETAEAFARYVRVTDVRNAGELKRGAGFLWVDALAPDERKKAYRELQRGEVRLRQLETLDGSAAIACPGGLIHHWVGAIFIPGASVDDVLALLKDYDHHAIYYAPDVERSKLESRDGDHFRAFLRFRRKKVITVVLDTEHDVHYFRDAPGRAHSRSSAVRVAQVENAGERDEREKKPGDDDGFMWKMETWWRIEAASGGVYVQSEVVSLTRGIPAGLGWMIGPFITGIPKEALTFTLEATRRAVVEKKKQ